MDRNNLQDPTAERAVIGSILLDPAVLDTVFLKPEDFGVEVHRLVFEAVLSLADKGTPPDLVTVSSALKGTVSASVLSEMTSEGGFLSLVPHYCKTVHKYSTARKLALACRGILENLTDDEALDKAESAIMEIREGSGAKQTAVCIKDVLGPVSKNLEALGKRSDPITGVPTGFYDLDRKTAGFQAGDLIIVAGRPSMGKTAFALNLAEYAASRHHECLVFSLEMSKEQLAKRLLSSAGSVDGQKIRTGQLQEADWSKLTTASGQIAGWPVWVDDSCGLTIMDLRAKARRHKRQHGLSLIVIDYLQLMQAPKAETHNLAVGEITRRLKALAKELNVPVVCLSQLSRKLEERADKRPIMADLRDSGNIEQDADVILFLYRESVYCTKCKEGTCEKPQHDKWAEVILGKQRNGPTGTIKLLWQPGFTKFCNLDEIMGDKNERFR